MKLEKNKVIPAVLCAVLLTILLPGPSRAAEFRGGGQANKCLDVPNGENGTRVQFWACNDKEFQQWRILPTGVIQGLDGKCLDWNSDDGERNFTRVQVWTCHDGENQQWTITNGEVRSKGGWCLGSNVSHGGAPELSDGTDLILRQCDGNASQKWIVQ